MNGARSGIFCPAPWDPGERSKVKYHLKSITKSILKIFMPNSGMGRKCDKVIVSTNFYVIRQCIHSNHLVLHDIYKLAILY